MRRIWLILPLVPAALGLWASGALAAQPEPWQMNFQPAANSVMERVTSFHDLLLWVITLISIFVLVLMVYVCIRFRAERNPTPSRRTHHAALEVAWTAVPVLILVVIAIPSLKLLYYMDVVEDPEMTIKAIGNQWYWSYEYPDHGGFLFDAYMLADDELEEGDPRLLATDNNVVVPVGTRVRLVVTATDVLHSWAMPAFGVKLDGVPGRLNETWFEINEPGMYYGQCSELCGAYHGFMPISVEALPKDEFEAWVTEAQVEFARADSVEIAKR